MTPEEERGIFLQLERIEQKTDWLSAIISVVAVSILFNALYNDSRGTWASGLVDWLTFPAIIVMLAIIRHSYNRIELLQVKAAERLEAAELDRQRASERRAAAMRKDLEQRWREFRGPGLFPHKECRDWWVSVYHLDSEWRSHWATLADDTPSPPFVSSDEARQWQTLWEEKMFECHERRKVK